MTPPPFAGSFPSVREGIPTCGSYVFYVPSVDLPHHQKTPAREACVV
jgi:hypothetical protein